VHKQRTYWTGRLHRAKCPFAAKTYVHVRRPVTQHCARRRTSSKACLYLPALRWLPYRYGRAPIWGLGPEFLSSKVSGPASLSPRGATLSSNVQVTPVQGQGNLRRFYSLVVIMLDFIDITSLLYYYYQYG
jgi:hypothetical protein